MKVRLLGTGGADGIPSMFGDSRVSRYARECGGKDVRSRSAALIDDGLKLDLPPDTFSQLARDGLSAADWTAVVFTHSDDDHIAVNQLQYALFPFTDREFAPFAIYGNEAVLKRIWNRYPDWPFELHLTRSFESFEHSGYTITPFEANHKEDEDSQNLVISKGGRTLIYATDTGVWGGATWEFLSSVRADALVIECTNGRQPQAYLGHLDLPSCSLVVSQLREASVLSTTAKVFTTHHSHSGDLTHAELEVEMVPHGMAPGWDGFVFDV